MTLYQDTATQARELSTTELVDRLSSQVSLLVRDEMALATTEPKGKGRVRR